MTNASAETGLASAPPAPAVPAEPAGGLSPAASARLHAGVIWTLVRTDFKVRYHGTFGGFAWALFKPIAMFAMLLAVFSFLFSAPNYKLDLIIGLFLWDFFAEGTRAGLASLHARGYLLGKARFPLWIFVVTSVSNAAITLTVFVGIILAFLGIAGQFPSTPALVLFLVYAAALAMIVIGISLATSVLFLRYRDLNQLWDLMIQAGFFLAPIIYPLSILPERFHLYLYLWPPTPVIEFSRSVLVRGVTPTLTAHLCLFGVVVAVLGVGWLSYRRLSLRSAEYL